MNPLIINAILGTPAFVAVVGPLLWVIGTSNRDELDTMATPQEHAARALTLSAVLETGS